MSGSAALWENLPRSAQSQLEKAARRLQFERGDTIYKTGDLPQGLYFVQQGLVGLTLVGASGKEHLLRFFKVGQFFGHRSLFSEEPFHASAVALESTVLQFVGKREIFAVLDEDPRIYRFVVRVLAQELRRSEMQHVMVLENQILARTAHALVYLKDLHADHKWTRQEIASFCASTTSTVIKALGKLEEMGLVRQKGRSIDILDRDALVSLQE